jgi:hypothetical protein
MSLLACNGVLEQCGIDPLMSCEVTKYAPVRLRTYRNNIARYKRLLKKTPVHRKTPD